MLAHLGRPPGLSGVEGANGISAYTLGTEALMLGDALLPGATRQRLRRAARLATGCRVVERRTASALRHRTAGAVPAGIDRAVVGARGAFTVLDGAIDGRPGWRPGVDARLRRRVWIRDLPVGTPAVGAPRATVARLTRLRWLAGRRTPQEAGMSTRASPACRSRRPAGRRRPWSEVRRWLVDLAHELAAQRPGRSCAARARPRLDPRIGTGQAARRPDRRPGAGRRSD